MAQPSQFQASQPQQQHTAPSLQAPPRPFSPPVASPSPATSQGFTMPPNKRARLSPDPRRPASPFAQQQTSYPIAPSTPVSTTASPHFANSQLPNSNAATPSTTQQHFKTEQPASTPQPTPFPVAPSPAPYTTPYSNGNISTPMTVPSLPNQNLLYNNGHPPNNNYSSPSTPNNFQQAQQFSPHPQTTNGFPPNLQFTPNHNQFPNSNNFAMAPQAPGSMGPPTKPVERENDDQTDVLANAGVDIRAEESYAMSFYTGSFNSQPSFSGTGAPAIGHAFTQFGPGDEASFYGAGPANQPGESSDGGKQDGFLKEQVDRAWAEAASSLARSREHELSNPHVQVAVLWRKMDKIARDQGVVLNTDPGGKMPTLKLASEFRGDVRAQTAAGQQVSLTATGGPFLPADTALADQLALMSLATNQRLRLLLEEAYAISKGRRTGADGVVPAEWVNAAAPIQNSGNTIVPDGSPRNGWESAVSPMTITLKKRSYSDANRLPTPVIEGAKSSAEAVRYTSPAVKTLREFAIKERDIEEERLKRRGERAAGGPRSGTAAPGTPINGAAPEKPMTKKEREKQDKGKAGQANDNAAANNTMNIMFGSKKKSKYSWMTGGGGGSGASTPAKLMTQGLPGTPAAMVEKVRLTAEGGRPIGGLRENDQKMVEMKDWILALENDSREPKALQKAYANPAYDKK